MYPPRVDLNNKTDRKPLQFSNLLKLNEQARVTTAK